MAAHSEFLRVATKGCTMAAHWVDTTVEAKAVGMESKMVARLDNRKAEQLAARTAGQ